MLDKIRFWELGQIHQTLATPNFHHLWYAYYQFTQYQNTPGVAKNKGKAVVKQNKMGGQGLLLLVGLKMTRVVNQCWSNGLSISYGIHDQIWAYSQLINRSYDEQIDFVVCHCPLYLVISQVVFLKLSDECRLAGLTWIGY